METIKSSHINVDHLKNGGYSVKIENLGVATKRNKSSFTVFCPALKVLGYGKSQKDAFEDFHNNLVAFFDIHIKDQTLDAALINFKWKKDVISPVLKKNEPNYAIDNRHPALHPKDFELSIAA